MDIKVRKIYVEAIKKILPDIYKNGKTDEKCPFCMKDIVYENNCIKSKTPNCFVHNIRGI